MKPAGRCGTSRPAALVDGMRRRAGPGARGRGPGGAGRAGRVPAARAFRSGGAVAAVGCPGVLVGRPAGRPGRGAVRPGAAVTTSPTRRSLPSLFRLGAAAPEGWLAAVITAGSIAALVGLCWLALGAAGVRPRPATVFAVAALALLTWPVDYTLHLGEIDLIVAALVGADLLRPPGRRPVAGDRHRAGRRDQAHPADLRGLPAAHPPRPGGRHRRRELRRHDRRGPGSCCPPQSRVFWLDGVFGNPEPGREPGQPVEPVAGRGDRPARRRPGRGPGDGGSRRRC